MAENVPEDKTPPKTIVLGTANFASATPLRRGDLASPPAIPDHELIRCIGGGSYGQVWLARNVMGGFRAVKIIHRQAFDNDRPFEREFRGIQNFEPISRFQENQVDILHVGRAEDYFYYVMELADDQAGGPAMNPDHYAAKTLRSEQERLGRLPIQSCLEVGLALSAALAFLHQRGLTHRDVKPSNVIYVNGVPKLADIGLVTGMDQTVSFAGTEGFIAPEGPGTPQADLYSLGKVLYEIGTGKDRQDYPEPPTLLGDLPDRQELLELSEIIKKACAPKPADRYASAEAMQADLLLLKTGKSVRHTHQLERRLKVMMRLAAATAAVVVLGIVPYYLAIREARRATATAKREAQQRQRAEAGEKKALTEAVRSHEVARLLGETLASAGPLVALGRDSSMLREILQKTAQRAARELTNQPEVAADLFLIIGKTYADMGQFTNAVAVTREAVRLRRLSSPEDSLESATALHDLGAILCDADDLPGAEEADRAALRIKRAILGHDDTNVAETLNNLGVALWYQAKLPEAEEMERLALAIRKEELPATNIDIGKTIVNLAGVLSSRGDLAGAEAQFVEAAAFFRTNLSANHPYVAVCLNNLGTVRRKKGDLTGAEAAYTNMLAIRKAIYGSAHPEVANALTQLALVRARRGQFNEAEVLARDSLAMETKLSLGDHAYVADSLAALGFALSKKGDFKGAGENFGQALAMRQKLLGAESPDVAEVLDWLAILRATGGDLETTVPMLQNALAMDQKTSSAENPDLLPLLSHLAWVLSQKAGPAAATTVRQQAAVITAKQNIYAMSAWAEGSYDLADLLQVRGKFAQAEPLLLETAGALAKGSRAIQPLRRRSLEKLVQLYETWERSDSNADVKANAAIWRAKLASYDAS
jgi:tetratricopeptide (TPR) repeat protein